MILSPLLLLALLGGPKPHELTLRSDTELLTATEQAFAEGERSRHDATQARKWFADAARGYDELWARGFHNPALALNRGNAHRLAGDLPGSIAAYQAGLTLARFNRPLQQALADARAAVAYPLDGELAAECRPATVTTVGTRMSPLEAYTLTVGGWLFICLGAVRYAMTRNRAWIVVVVCSFVGLALLGGLWWHDWREQRRTESRPLAIVTTESMLRKGNGENWEPRLPQRLPSGVEARALAERGGWVQIELAGGAVGWLPADTVLILEPPAPATLSGSGS